MPSYDSKDGVWIPKIEKVALINKETDEPFIYEGPDRAAFAYLKEQGVDHLGVPFDKDPDIIFRAKQFNMTLEEFCELSKNTEAARKATFDKAHAEKQLHRPIKPEERKKPVNPESGGKDTTNPKNNMAGAMTGLPSNVPAELGKQALNK